MDIVVYGMGSVKLIFPALLAWNSENGRNIIITIGEIVVFESNPEETCFYSEMMIEKPKLQPLDIVLTADRELDLELHDDEEFPSLMHFTLEIFSNFAATHVAEFCRGPPAYKPK